ncbi:hypothetical protein [Flexivirga meconopsidis]|uniref:hypothetical protein n=1 Tax=Flexivirga meconopsidis TaxID=2977121 RepID=UPI00223FD7A5|nr:hypothetical protein [Flexivirga meconopsidis]
MSDQPSYGEQPPPGQSPYLPPDQSQYQPYPPPQQFEQPQYAQPQYGQPGQWQQQPPYAPQPAASVVARSIGWVIVGLGVLGVIGSVLPWANGPFGISVSGTDGDGGLTLVLFLAAGVLGVVRGLGRWMLGAAIVALVMGALCSLTALIDMGDLADSEFASVGGGLILVLLAGLGLIGAGVFGIVRRR